MRIGLTVSAFGHAALIAWGLFSLPAPRAPDASLIEAIPVDFVDIGAETSLPKGLQTSVLTKGISTQEAAEEPPPLPKPPPPPPPEPKPTPPQPPSPEPPPPPQPPPPPPQMTEEAPPPPPPQETAAVPEPKPREVSGPVPVPRPKPRLPRQAPKEPDPPPAEQRNDPLDIDTITAMLDNEPEQPQPAEQPPDEQPAFGSTVVGSADARMTVNELDALRARIAQCWSPPLGWSDPSEVRVVLMLYLAADGSMSAAPQVLEAPSGRYQQAAPESAVRAVHRCAPYNLPPEKYEAWKQVKVTFDPTDMGGV